MITIQYCCLGVLAEAAVAAASTPLQECPAEQAIAYYQAHNGNHSNNFRSTDPPVSLAPLFTGHDGILKEKR